MVMLIENVIPCLQSNSIHVTTCNLLIKEVEHVLNCLGPLLPSI